MNNDLPDVQKQKEGFYQTPIRKVGVRNIKLPFRFSYFKDRNSHLTNLVIGTFSGYCKCKKDQKGINMSRIYRSIDEIYRTDDGHRTLRRHLEHLCAKNEVDEGYLKCKFDLLWEAETPVSKLKTWEPLGITLESIKNEDGIKNYLTVKMTVMSLCPCSKEMSLLENQFTREEKEILETYVRDSLLDKIYKAGFGAHNQKSVVEVKIEMSFRTTEFFYKLVDAINEAGSSPCYSMLKREDEKYITEKSYDNPKFVEDISRDISASLDISLKTDLIKDYCIIVNNAESIHSGDIQATSVLSANLNLK